jgi:hypothetical protein
VFGTSVSSDFGESVFALFGGKEPVQRAWLARRARHYNSVKKCLKKKQSNLDVEMFFGERGVRTDTWAL